MKKLLYKWLDLEEGELRPVALLLSFSFFLGIALVTFDVGANSLFLTTYGEKNIGELAKAFMYSGIVGVVTTFIFVQLQNYISFSKLVAYTLVFVLLIVLALSVSLEITKQNFLIYFSVAFLGSFNSLTLLCFYGIISRSFNVRNEKRLTGTADQGQMFAVAFAFFALLVVQFFDLVTDTVTYLFVSVGALVVCFVLFSLYKKVATDERLLKPLRKSREQMRDVSVWRMAKVPYIRLLILMYFVSAAGFLIVEYSFLNSTANTFSSQQDTSKQVTLFLAAFGGILQLISVLFQVFFSDKIIQNYGVRSSMMILPILVILFTLMAGGIGTYILFSNEEATHLMAVFFIGICLSKFFLQIPKEAFEDPNLKNFYLPLDPNTRNDVQSRIEGVYYQFFFFVVAGLLVILGEIFHVDTMDGAQHLELVYFSAILLGVLAAYMFVVSRLTKSYRDILLNTLELTKANSTVKRSDFSVEGVLMNELNYEDPSRIKNTVNIIAKVKPDLVDEATAALLKDKYPELKLFALEKIDELKAFENTEVVRNVINSEPLYDVRNIAHRTLFNFEDADKLLQSDREIAKLATSQKVEDREYVARVLAKGVNDVTMHVLIALIRDTEASVRKIALLSAGKTQVPQFWPALLDHLNNPAFANAAASGIYQVGERIIPALDLAFYRTGQTFQAQAKILQILGRIGGSKAIEALWNKIDFPDKKITSMVLLSLASCNFKANSDQVGRIIQMIDQEIKVCAWKLAAYLESDDDDTVIVPIEKALLEEIEHNDHNIFMLLSLIYDPDSIRLVRENIESRTVEGVLYAIELLNVFLAEELKPTLFPVLDQISVQEKVEKLQVHYPRESLNMQQVLFHIINMDYNEINRWTKACAIYQYAARPDAKVTDSLVANLFNPDLLLREVSAWAIHKLDPQAYRGYMTRIKPEHKKQLDRIILQAANKNRYHRSIQFEKILFLKNIDMFSRVPGVLMAGLADFIEDVFIPKGDSYVGKINDNDSPIFVVVSGKVNIVHDGEIVEHRETKEVIGFSLIKGITNRYLDMVAEEDTLIYRIEKDYFYEMISNHYEMAEVIIPKMNELLEKENKENVITA